MGDVFHQGFDPLATPTAFGCLEPDGSGLVPPQSRPRQCPAQSFACLHHHPGLELCSQHYCRHRQGPLRYHWASLRCQSLPHPKTPVPPHRRRRLSTPSEFPSSQASTHSNFSTNPEEQKSRIKPEKFTDQALFALLDLAIEAHSKQRGVHTYEPYLLSMFSKSSLTIATAFYSLPTESQSPSPISLDVGFGDDVMKSINDGGLVTYVTLQGFNTVQYPLDPLVLFESKPDSSD